MLGWNGMTDSVSSGVMTLWDDLGFPMELEGLLSPFLGSMYGHASHLSVAELLELQRQFAIVQARMLGAVVLPHVYLQNRLWWGGCRTCLFRAHGAGVGVLHSKH